MSGKTVRIGGASGAWGDSPMAYGQLLGAGVDYLMTDYLAEVSMSLLARARIRDPDGGLPPDAVAYLKAVLPEIAGQRVRVATNAGGVNPAGCKRAIEAAIAELGLSLTVAVVEGDDVMPLLDGLRETVREAVSGAALPKRMLTANAYLGALPIKAAFDQGADIVVTGRCAGRRRITTCSARAASWATCWNAGRRRRAAISPTGSACRTGTISATRSRPAAPMAALS
jgi:hypothetical protein